MADLSRERVDTHAPITPATSDVSVGITGPDWKTEDAYWQSAYPERPYARADRSFEYYRDAYRYGAVAAMRYRGRGWSEIEESLRRDWEARTGGPGYAWDEMKEAVRDAWDHVRGESDDDRTHIR